MQAWMSVGRTATRKAETFLWERRLGISTRVPDHRPYDNEHLNYVTVPYRLIFKILERLELRSHDVFIDLGCGRGRVCCCAARSAVSAVLGVEDVKELADSARANLDRMRGARAGLKQVICGKAQECQYSSATVIYMFHPFGPTVMKEVLLRIKQSLDLAPRGLRIAYVNPIHESVLDSTGWLKRYDHWGPDCLPERKRTVSFWQATTAMRG
jgi:predicted RNA methylase